MINKITLQKEIKKKIKELPNSNLIILTGKSLNKLLNIKKIKNEVEKENKIKIKILIRRKKNPEHSELLDLNKKIKFNQYRNFLAIGGGATLDMAKIICNLETKQNYKRNIEVGKILYKKNFNLYLIPTTAGTGSEETLFSVFYIKKKKYSLVFPKNTFWKSLYIPQIILTNNSYTLASSGFDCFAQSMESLFSKSSNQESIKYSMKSLNYSSKYLLKNYSCPDFNSAKKMQIAARYSGKSINIAKTNLPHALSYWIADKLDISHGHSVSIFFEKIICYYFNKAQKSNKNYEKIFRRLFKIFKVKNISQLEEKILTIKRKLKLKNFKYFFKNKKNVDLLLKNINVQRLSNCFVPMNKSIILKIISNE